VLAQASEIELGSEVGGVRELGDVLALVRQHERDARAAATGATYVDFSKVSEGHDACQPIGTRWIEPVVGTTQAVVVHPNALGESQMAAQTIKVLHLG